ncbi:MAG: RNA polymerase sigma factor SigJ [Acidimicrobiales bacterium]
MSEVFEANRPRLVGVAYAMLGSVVDAEDIVQDVYMRWASVGHADIDSPVAYLTTITTRLALNRLSSAQRRRETYPGPWLPEPIVTDLSVDPADIVAEAEELSTAALAALERLKPVERAVLLLRDVFDLDYADIADIVEKSPANCRQIARRARDRAGDLSRSPRTTAERERQLITSYLGAMQRGDLDAMKGLFAEDVVLWADGGGNVRAAVHPLAGAWRVARHLVGVAHWTPGNAQTELVRVNSNPGFVARVDGVALCVTSFQIVDDVVIGLHSVVNPEKLSHLTR